MGFLDFVTKLSGGIVSPVTTYMTRRAELSLEKHKARIELIKAQGERQAALMSQGLTADANWEMEFAKQAQGTWKDEYTLLVVSIPAVMAFVPSYAPIVAGGFEALSKTPAWYQVVLISIFLATYGIRYWRRSQSDT